jgi:hypothetical protein
MRSDCAKLYSFEHGDGSGRSEQDREAGWPKGEVQVSSKKSDRSNKWVGERRLIPSAADTTSANSPSCRHRERDHRRLLEPIEYLPPAKSATISRSVTEHTECPLALSTRRVAIYISNADSRLAANQRAAMQRYVDNMDWIVTVIEDDRQRLLERAATSAFDLVVCWRTGDLRDPEFLFERLSAHGVELLAVAQSCAALPE